MDKELKIIGRRIKKLRKSINLTCSELASLVNIGDKHLNYIENGTKTPSLDLLYNVSKVLGIPLSSLFSEDSATLSKTAANKTEMEIVYLSLFKNKDRKKAIEILKKLSDRKTFAAVYTLLSGK